MSSKRDMLSSRGGIPENESFSKSMPKTPSLGFQMIEKWLLSVEVGWRRSVLDVLNPLFCR